MEFPKDLSNRIVWKVTKNGEDFWLKLSTREEKWIGLKTVYQRIKNLSEIVSEINIFGKGAVIQVWFPDIKKSPKMCLSRIMKNGNWVYGLPDAPISLEELRDENNRFCGVRISLKVSQDKTETVDILKKR